MLGNCALELLNCGLFKIADAYQDSIHVSLWSKGTETNEFLQTLSEFHFRLKIFEVFMLSKNSGWSPPPALLLFFLKWFLMNL